MAEAGAGEVVLASASASRRRLLEAAGVRFRVVPSGIDETALKRGFSGPSGGPDAVARQLARAKAEAVSARLPGALVIGADQVLALGDEMFDKPRGRDEARRHLMRLRGRSHRLLTSVALTQGGKTLWQHDSVATLDMREFSLEFIDRYLQEAGPAVTASVGAYELEGPGAQLFSQIEGDYFTILGLPLLPLLGELRARGALVT
jgi:septum formation protein